MKPEKNATHHCADLESMIQKYMDIHTIYEIRQQQK